MGRMLHGHAERALQSTAEQDESEAGPEAESHGCGTGQPAVVPRAAGKGRITYLGALLDGALMRSAMESMTKSAGLRPAFGPAPEDVEVCRRAGASGEVFVLINHGDQTRTVALPRPMRDLLSSGQVRSSATLPRQAVAVLQPANRPE